MNCITQMDLGRWFRNIEYLYGILNSINEKKKFTKNYSKNENTASTFFAFYLCRAVLYSILIKK